MEEVDKAYIAGFFDGEGSISIRLFTQKTGQEQTQIAVSIAQNDIEILKWIQSYYGGYIVGKNNPVYKKSYDLVFQRSALVIRFLTDMLPYLRVKINQAKVAIEFCTLLDLSKGQRKKTNPNVHKVRMELRQKMLSLNKKNSKKEI